MEDTYKWGLRKPTTGNEAHQERPELFHLSFNDKLEGLWRPKLPDGSELPSGQYAEPNTPRISFSPTIEGCFRAIYPNISHLFEVKKYPYLVFRVYRPILTDKIHLVTPDELTKEKQVWDAHVTREYHTEQAVKMVKVGKVMVKSPKNKSFLKTHPFGDKQLPPKNVGPKHIEWEWVERKETGLETHVPAWSEW